MEGEGNTGPSGNRSTRCGDSQARRVAPADPRTSSRDCCIEECSPRNPAGARGDNIELCLSFVKVSVMSTRVLRSTKSSASGFHLFIFGLNNSLIL